MSLLLLISGIDSCVRTFNCPFNSVNVDHWIFLRPILVYPYWLLVLPCPPKSSATPLLCKKWSITWLVFFRTPNAMLWCLQFLVDDCPPLFWKWYSLGLGRLQSLFSFVWWILCVQLLSSFWSFRTVLNIKNMGESDTTGYAPHHKGWNWVPLRGRGSCQYHYNCCIWHF